jgi:hypothetical protein
MLPLVQAKYRAKVCGAPSWAQSPNGNWQVALPFTVSQGEFTGETTTWIGVLHDTADKNGVTGSERVIQSLQYAGWQGDDIADLAELTDEQALAVFTEEVELACSPDTYNGKTHLKVNWVNKVGAGRFAFKEAASKNDLRSFAAQMKSTVKSLRGAAGSRSTTPPNGSAPAKPQVKDEDIPF